MMTTPYDPFPAADFGSIYWKQSASDFNPLYGLHPSSCAYEPLYSLLALDLAATTRLWDSVTWSQLNIHWHNKELLSNLVAAHHASLPASPSLAPSTPAPS